MTRFRPSAAVHAVFALVGAVSAQSAAAQEAQRIEITGSSIKRIDAETALPMQVVTRQDILKSGATNVEQLMQTISAAASSGALMGNASSGATTGSISSSSRCTPTGVEHIIGAHFERQNLVEVAQWLTGHEQGRERRLLAQVAQAGELLRKATADAQNDGVEFGV